MSDTTPKPEPTDLVKLAAIDIARGRYAAGSDDDIEVDDNAEVLPVMEDSAVKGHWVQMWGWVPHEEVVEGIEQGEPA